MFPVTVPVTNWVVTGKVAEIDPAGIVTVAGTEAALSVEERLTVVGTPAAVLSVTVPVAVMPPTMV
jgi:hypothetical protein